MEKVNLLGRQPLIQILTLTCMNIFIFVPKMLKKDDTKPVARGRSSNSPCMIVFCSFEQDPDSNQSGRKAWVRALHTACVCKNLTVHRY